MTENIQHTDLDAFRQIRKSLIGHGEITVNDRLMPVASAGLLTEPVLTVSETGFPDNRISITGSETVLVQSYQDKTGFEPGDVRTVLEAAGLLEYFPDRKFPERTSRTEQEIMDLAAQQAEEHSILRVTLKSGLSDPADGKRQADYFVRKDNLWLRIALNFTEKPVGEYSSDHSMIEGYICPPGSETQSHYFAGSVLEGLGIIPQFKYYGSAFLQKEMEPPDPMSYMETHARQSGSTLIWEQFTDTIRTFPPKFDHEEPSDVYLGPATAGNVSGDGYVSRDGSLIVQFGHGRNEFITSEDILGPLDDSEYKDLLTKAMKLGLIIPNHYPFLPEPEMNK